MLPTLLRIVLPVVYPNIYSSSTNEQFRLFNSTPLVSNALSNSSQYSTSLPISFSQPTHFNYSLSSASHSNYPSISSSHSYTTVSISKLEPTCMPHITTTKTQV